MSGIKRLVSAKAFQAAENLPHQQVRIMMQCFCFPRRLPRLQRNATSLAISVPMRTVAIPCVLMRSFGTNNSIVVATECC